MDEQPPKCSSAISVESDQSQNLSLRSLRPIIPQVTPKSNASLIEVVSIEKSSSSSGGLMNRVLGQIVNQQILNIMGQEVNQFTENRSLGEHKIEQQTKQRASHACVCLYKCLREDCECFKYEDQQCEDGLCCETCVKAKIEMLKPVSKGRGSAQFRTTPKQAIHNSINKQKNSVFCQCFKINCLKKYCSCFAAGQRCGPKCRCQQCDNWSSEQPQLPLPLVYNDNNLPQMPQSMDFEPPNF